MNPQKIFEKKSTKIPNTIHNTFSTLPFYTIYLSTNHHFPLPSQVLLSCWKKGGEGKLQKKKKIIFPSVVFHLPIHFLLNAFRFLNPFCFQYSKTPPQLNTSKTNQTYQSMLRVIALLHTATNCKRSILIRTLPLLSLSISPKNNTKEKIIFQKKRKHWNFGCKNVNFSPATFFMFMTQFVSNGSLSNNVFF